MEIVHVLASQNVIGEGPLWNGEEQALYWVDIAGKTISRYWPSSGRHEVFPTSVQVGVIAFRARGGLVAAGDTGFNWWDTETGELKPICDPESDRPESRINDGKVDRKGRFWAGSMTSEGAVSSLYRLDRDLAVHQMDTGFTISNGIGWSPDNRTMYFADSFRYVVYAYDFDLASGGLANRRDFIVVKPEYGIPDGLTVDAEGFVWCAFYAGSKVTRFTPQGRIDLEVRLPVSQPTSCIFGGAEYKDLYVTSAWNGLNPEQRKNEPQAGDLFVIKTDTIGIPEPKFAG